MNNLDVINDHDCLIEKKFYWTFSHVNRIFSPPIARRRVAWRVLQSKTKN